MKFLLKSQLCFLLSFWQNPFKTGLHLIICSLFLRVLFLNWSECYSQNCVCRQQAYFIRFKIPSFTIGQWRESSVYSTCAVCAQGTEVHRVLSVGTFGFMGACLTRGSFDSSLVVEGLSSPNSHAWEEQCYKQHVVMPHIPRETRKIPDLQSFKAAPRPLLLHKRDMEKQ